MQSKFETFTQKGLSAFINGQWITGKEELISTNPADHRDKIAIFSNANKETVRQAALAARHAWQDWSSTPAPVRASVIKNFGALLTANKESLAQLVSREIGKPLRESLGSVQEAIDTCDFFVSEGRRLYGQTIPSEMREKELYTYRKPIGVFGCMTACNFPVAVPAWYFIPALITGNTCVWKPSEDALLVSYYWTQLLHKAGVPKGVFNVVFGTGSHTGANMVDLIDEGCFDKFGFTGSTEVGRRIGEICGRNLQVPCLELGGKNPLVVTEKANIDLAVDGAVWGGSIELRARAIWPAFAKSFE